MDNNISIMKLLNASTYSDIFSEIDKVTINKEYKEFAMIAHPDKGGNTDLMQKLNKFHQDALAAIGESKNNSCLMEIRKMDSGKTIRYIFKEILDFELGKVVIGQSYVLYLVEKQYKDLYDNAIMMISKIKYPNSSMEGKNSPYLPKIKTFFESDEYYCLQLTKEKDFHRLGILKDYVNILDVKHIAWIITRLLNISCVLEYSGIVHNGITLDTCFISPEYHSIALLGGWWYCTDVNAKMIGTTSDVFNIMSNNVKTSKLSSFSTDIDSIKNVARRLNGGSVVYTKDGTLPEPMAIWLNSASSLAHVEYDTWENVLIKSFGERKFISLDISENDMYTTRRK